MIIKASSRILIIIASMFIVHSQAVRKKIKSGPYDLYSREILSEMNFDDKQLNTELSDKLKTYCNAQDGILSKFSNVDAYLDYVAQIILYENSFHKDNLMNLNERKQMKLLAEYHTIFASVCHPAGFEPDTLIKPVREYIQKIPEADEWRNRMVTSIPWSEYIDSSKDPLTKKIVDQQKDIEWKNVPSFKLHNAITWLGEKRKYDVARDHSAAFVHKVKQNQDSLRTELEFVVWLIVIQPLEQKKLIKHEKIKIIGKSSETPIEEPSENKLSTDSTFGCKILKCFGISLLGAVFAYLSYNAAAWKFNLPLTWPFNLFGSNFSTTAIQENTSTVSTITHDPSVIFGLYWWIWALIVLAVLLTVVALILIFCYNSSSSTISGKRKQQQGHKKKSNKSNKSIKKSKKRKKQISSSSSAISTSFKSKNKSPGTNKGSPKGSTSPGRKNKGKNTPKKRETLKSLKNQSTSSSSITTSSSKKKK